MLRSAPAISALSTRTVSALMSMPWLSRHSRSSLPLMRAECISPSVFSLTPVKRSASISTLPPNSGSSLTSTTSSRALAMVSVRFGIESLGFPMCRPLISRLSGNDSPTRSILMSMPVCSEAYAVTLPTAHLWNGGKYISAVSATAVIIMAIAVTAVHFMVFFISYPKSVITTLIFLFRLGNPFPGCLQPLASILPVVFS